MRAVYSSGFQPNPYDTIDVLAFVLCSPHAFVPGTEKGNMAAALALIQPAKEEAIRLWKQAQIDKMRS